MRLVATVPAPPWWTAAVTPGSARACEKPSAISMSGASGRGGRAPAAPASSPRQPTTRSASTTRASTRCGLREVMLPNPTNTGGGPSRRNAATRASSRSHDPRAGAVQ